MGILETFIPIDRRLALARGESLPDRASGTALFMDVSGFTPLTEALTRLHGPQRGAEELTRHLDRVYDALIAEVDRYGGSVVGFSGDAITCWFDENPSGQSSSALRAVACGLAMQEAIRKYGTIVIGVNETVAVNVKVAITSGNVRRFQVGDPEIRYIDTLAGLTLDYLAAEEQSAQKGEVLLDEETAKQLGDKVQVSAWRDSKGRRSALVSALTVSVAPQLWPATSDGLAEEQVRPWVLPFIYERTKSGIEEFLAELRPVVSIFVNFGGINYDSDPSAGEKLDEYICWVQHILARYEGTLVELVIGDKGSYLYATIGAPIAHDDDALRALAAARELRTLPPELNFITGVRIGISRGHMRVGPYGGRTRRTYGAIGDETNVAARLMQHAASGQIIVSDRVAQLTDHRYQFRALGAVKVKGRVEPVTIFGLVGMRSEPSPVGGVSTPERRRAPMVGRAAERGVLSESLNRLLKEHRGGTLIIQGDAGIGKSRLVEELLEEGREVGATCILAAGDAVEQSAIYFPWREVFSQVFELDTLPDDAAVRRAQVMNWLESNADDPDLVRLAPLLNAVLPLNLPENEQTAGMTGRVRADATRDLLARILRRTMRATPLVIVIEDAHWLDSASWALLERVAALDAPLLLVIATRPFGATAPAEFERLRAAPETRLLILEPLPSEDVSTLIQQRLGVRTLPEPVLNLIRERAEGNPFFSEELAYALRDSGVIVLRDGVYELAPDAPDLETLRFPDTVQGVITSRIDRLTPSQQLAIKVASVIGRIFAFRVLCDIEPVPEDTEQLEHDLSVLATLDLTPIESREPELRYIFKHVITQQVAYNLLLFSQRQQIHRLIAEWYERTFPDALNQYYPLLSYHWSNVVQVEPAEPAALLKAIDYLRRAGKQAVEGNANQEAVEFLTHALELVHRLPEGADRLKLELGSIIDLAPALIATRGYGDPNVERNFARARQICEQLGLVPQLFPVLNGLNFYYMVRVNLPAAYEIADLEYEVARQLKDPALLRPTANALMATRFFSGNLAEAVTYLDMVATPIPVEQERALATAFVHNPTQATTVIGGTGLWILGYPDKGLVTSKRAVQLARDISHPYSLAYATLFHSVLRGLLGEIDVAAQIAEETVTVSKKYGFPVWAANGSAVHGWAISRLGEPDKGIPEIQQGIAIYQRIGIDLAVPLFLGMLADVYLNLGDTQSGLDAVGRALEQARRTGELWNEAELCRIKGELLLRQTPSDRHGAEELFREAIELAKRQQARSWELRATMSLARLLKEQGKKEDARRQLTEIYNWFTEGFETADLKEARTLLDEL